MASLSEAVYQYKMHIIFSVTGGGGSVGVSRRKQTLVAGGNMRNIGSGGGVGLGGGGLKK